MASSSPLGWAWCPGSSARAARYAWELRHQCAKCDLYRAEASFRPTTGVSQPHTASHDSEWEEDRIALKGCVQPQLLCLDLIRFLQSFLRWHDAVHRAMPDGLEREDLL